MSPKCNESAILKLSYELDEEGEERYLGFNFGINGVNSKVEKLILKIETLSKSYSKISSTFKGRLAILKSYLLSQLTFHLYISEIENLTQLETICANMIFKGNNKWKMSKKRCRKDYAMGGLELWNMELRALAQKAWIYEWYLRDKDTDKCSSFMNKWKSESLNNLSSIHYLCWEAWLKLHSPKERISIDFNNATPYFQHKTKLKIIYKKIEARKVTVVKGRDLIWRYLLKALPKYFGELCYSCGESESSEHIFFNCKVIQPICNKIYSRVTSITNNTNYGVWSESILERLFDKFQANLVGAIMEVIWSRRNSLKFDFKDKAITFKMTIYILSKARDADWDRTIKTIEHLRRLELKNHQLDHTWKIMKKLEKFSHVWNSQLMKTYIPDHLIHYCSFNTNFLNSNN
ncbi:hypothetical protein ACTFIR_005583 [Dictyostelium discoideum]